MATSEETPTQARIERLPRADPRDQSNDTFVLHQHDHTLGNPLRHMILKDPRTEFCGYSVIHPTEENIHLRIQSKPNTASSVELLRTGLEKLKEQSQFIAMEYDDALDAFREKSQAGTQKS